MILSRSVTFSGRDLENSASYWCRERRKWFWLIVWLLENYLTFSILPPLSLLKLPGDPCPQVDDLQSESPRGSQISFQGLFSLLSITSFWRGCFALTRRASYCGKDTWSCHRGHRLYADDETMHALFVSPVVFEFVNGNLRFSFHF